MNTKRCSKCQEEKPATSEFFYKKKEGKFGVMARCIECTLQERKEYQKKNKKKISIRKKVYQKKNAESIAEYQKQYKQDNKEKLQEQAREWRENNKDSRKEYMKEYGKKYYQDNKDVINERQKQYTQDNKEKISERRKKWRQKNRKKILEQNKKYREENRQKRSDYNKQHYLNNKEKYVAKRAKRRFLQFQQTSEWANLVLIEQIYESCPKGYHVDHMTPLAAGGLHHESNLCYLPAEVNLSKGTKTIDEFGQEQFNQHVIYWQDVL